LCAHDNNQQDAMLDIIRFITASTVCELLLYKQKYESVNKFKY